MPPAIVCVVQTGTPRIVAKKSAAAPAVSAQKPSAGVILVMRIPIVRTIRHPLSM